MKSPTPTLLPLLRTKAQGDIMTWLALHPEEDISLTELAERTSTSPATAMREVNRLVAAGLVTARRSGNQRKVRMRTDTLLFRPLAQLLAVAFGPLPVISALLRKLPGIDEAYIYGSWAARYSGEAGEVPRDIDVLVVGRGDPDELDAVARAAEARLGREVNLHQIRPQQWSAIEAPDSFVATVRSRPMVPLDLDGAP